MYFTFFMAIFLFFSISSALPFPPPRFLSKKFKTVNGKRIAYVEVGSGDPIVFLHGNPTSSFLWRNVMPHLEGRGRLIAPDLIGMGDSEKLDPARPDRYTFVDHSNFLFALLEQLDVKERVTLVIHDWGSALGFLWAYYNRFNPNAIKGIAFMEAIVAPIPSFPPPVSSIFEDLRGPKGEELVLQNNIFIEQLFAPAIQRDLTKREFDEYRRPYLLPGEDRRPMLTWARQAPIGGEPADVVALISKYSEWMGTATFPKLFVNGDPGSLLTGAFRELVRTWPALTEVTVKGLHYLQEDSPDEIGMAIAKWLPM